MYCSHKYLHLIGTLSTQGMGSGMGQGSDLCWVKSSALSECIFQTAQLIYMITTYLQVSTALFEHGEYIGGDN